MRIIALGLAGLTLLTACNGKPADDTGAHTTAPADAAGSGHTPPKDWNAVDACSVLTKEMFGEGVGKTVVSTSLGLVNESDGTTAAGSECTYAFDDISPKTVMLRWSPISDNTDETIAMTRNALQSTAGAFGGTVETVDGVGKSAFWVAKIDSLNVFIDDKRMAIINVPSGPDARAQAIAIARKLGA